ncbi:MAG TPA: hypothetical protein VGR06_04555 [Actinophytocola sp.]|jgi:hypothetical protein|uniref:hypothetical protein n=1 Tax=Actinophytocola sp. TaxID=1872138 RepID=UPI002DF991F2|nr:hypothetical protein [Actinophytocola sp.]
MGLPPGRGPIPVSGIDASNDPELAKAAGELNAWIDYLLHPELNDGPRIYRYVHPKYPDEPEMGELPYRNPWLDDRPQEYETRSVLENYAADIGAFFRPAQAVSGISESLIERTYSQLSQGCFTWNKQESNDAPAGGDQRRVLDVHYPELHPARNNWMQMRKSWISRQDNAAHEFEGDFIKFQVFTENCFYVVAEHLVRYRAIFKKAGEDIARLMFGLTDKFATFNPFPEGGGVGFNFLSIVVTGLVAAATAVITEGTGVTAGVLLGSAVADMLGEAVKTANSTGPDSTQYQLESREHLRDVAKQYLDAVEKIESDVSWAINQLFASLRVEVDKLRTERMYEAVPGTGTNATSVPRYRDYL